MADQTYRVAIVGAGQHVVYTSDVHSLRDDPSIPVRDTVEAGHAASLALIPNVQVVGICDVDPERTEHFRRTWSGRWLDLRTYSDHQEMLHSEEIDILTVATPEHLHAGSRSKRRQRRGEGNTVREADRDEAYRTQTG